jgi:anti-anti-sigma factor
VSSTSVADSSGSGHLLFVQEGDLSVAVAARGRSAVVTVLGEIDSVTADRFEAACRHAATVGVVVVDVSDVTFMDSSGLNALVRARAATRPEWHLCGLRPRLRTLFRITGLDDVFLLHDGVAEALLTLERRPHDDPAARDGADGSRA